MMVDTVKPRLARPAWAASAIEVHPSQRTEAMLPIGVVSERTGVPVTSIRSAMQHPRDHANTRAALRPLACPRWRVGDDEPAWSDDQIRAYWSIVGILDSSNKTWAHLPRLTEEQAVLAQLISLSGMGDRGPAIGKTNLDRWKKREYFPQPLARIDRVSSPMLLYPWRTTEHLDEVLRSGATDDTGDVAVFLAHAHRQLTVSQWLRQHNPDWVAAHPDSDLDMRIDRP